jgi:uncharacterized protein YacL
MSGYDRVVGSLLLKAVLVALCALLGALARPPALHPLDFTGPAMGLVAGAVILGLERSLRDLKLRVLFGGLAGLLVGALAAALLLSVLPAEMARAVPPAATRGIVLLLCAYLGLTVGAARAGRLSPAGLRTMWRDGIDARDVKIVDTSAIIDGRIADVAETGFLDGTLVVPQFVLRELQHIADSSDALRRNRGRKGLEILQRLKKGPAVRVVISETDFPDLSEVDLKLIELARQMEARILTNDFNLNKVAELRGVRVLNVNTLANALRPVVLPGESMTIFVLKEGKEQNQGVGYLDDGTMVVVDNAKRYIGRNIAITVTSVLQTTAGKMFFGRCEGGEEAMNGEMRVRRTPA